MSPKIGIIIRREYLERVKKKSFIITTILMPLFMVALMIAPALIAMFNTPELRSIAVLDKSGIIAPRLTDTDEIHFINADAPRDSLINSGNYYGVLVIDRDILASPTPKLYLTDPSSMVIESSITSQIKDIVRDTKLREFNIDNIDQILAAADSKVQLQTFRTDKSEDSEAESSMVSYIIGMAMNFILYMFLLIYGQMIMTSIIEEKNNRVLEIVVSSINPTDLMLGKIIGVGMVALTQIVLWAAIILSLMTFVMPALIPADLLSGASSSSMAMDADELAAISMLTNVGYIARLLGYMVLFLVGGFLFYAAINAAIGSAVDNIQDAGQLQSVAVLPIIIGLVLSTTVASDPNSLMAVIFSLVPFTSPMVMMSRIPFGIAGWEIWTSLILLYASVFGMVWIAAKIYRIGIFMYGKKPTIKELIRWARYK